MLSEIKNLCKRLYEWTKNNKKLARRGGELYLFAVIILVATISFGLGRLSKIREEKTPITIENAATSTEITANVSNKNVTEKILERPKFLTSEMSVEIGSAPVAQKFGNISESQKIFVASRNGKKYYYAWCESANVIKEQNRIWFATQEEAQKAGYQPAANCKGLK